MNEVITSLDFWLMEVLSMIETMKTEIKALKEGVGVGGSSSLERDRKAKVESIKPPIFKVSHEIQEMDNFL